MNPKTKLIFWLIAAAFLVAMGVAASFRAFQRLDESVTLRQHIFQILSSSQMLLSQMKDAETGQRGFLLTGDETYLEPFENSQEHVRLTLNNLNETTTISAARQHLDALSPLIENKFIKMNQAIRMKRSGNDKAALDGIKDGFGKTLMDSIRAEIAEFSKIENEALVEYEAGFQLRMRNLFSLIVVASIMAMLFALLFAYMVYRDTERRLQQLLLAETRHLLKAQEMSNVQLAQVNNDLRVSEENLAVTLNSVGDAVLATDAAACVTLLNPVAELLTGWTQAEANGRPVAEVFKIINQETRVPATIPVIATLEHGLIQGLANHTVLIAKDGSECAIADSCAPIRGRDGIVVGAVLVFRNVTNEYAVQQALRDSAALVQTVLNTVADGVVTLHARGASVETVNPAAERMFGYSGEELNGKNFCLLIPELDQDQHEGSLEYYSASDVARASGIGREVIGRRRNGSTFPLEIAVSEMWLGGQRYFTGILRDISARKQAEAALLKAGALQNAIFNSANFSSIATDAKGVIQIFNVGAERMLGYAAVDVMNKITPADISDPDEVIARATSLSVELDTKITPGFEALVFKASRGIEDIYELTYIRKDGSRLPAVVSVTALRDEQEIIIGYLLIGTDNTARKVAEAALVKAGALQSAIFNSANFSSIATDAKGVIQIFNVGAERMLGYSAAEVMNKITPADISDPQEVVLRAKTLSAELDTTITPGFEALVFKASRGIEDIYELTYVRKDGGRIPAVVSVTALRDEDEAIIGYLLIGTDNTARKQIEAERTLLDQALQNKNVELENARALAEKANLAKSDFLSSMSHELRTPLSAILGFAQLIESSSPPPTSSQRRSVEQILKAGWYLLELINEVLDLAVIESGKMSLSLEVVGLSEVLQECKTMVEPQAKGRNISVNFAAGETPYFVYGDRTRIKQVLINLLSNAIKYNNIGGTVTVELAPQSTESIRISVKDNGEGLAPELLAQLFQPFNRLGHKANIEEGTGIGLVVSKRLVELMKGSIGVESTVGIGSVFWIELKLTTESKICIDQTDAARLALISTPDTSRIYTLLYVEDNPANMMLVEDIIARRSDICLLSARDGRKGVALARASLPDVILMDINLPGISGIEALKVLSEDVNTMHIPVIALSANAIPRDIQRGLDAGFFRYLTKPIKVGEFMDTLDLALKIANHKSTAELTSNMANPPPLADLEVPV